MDGQNGAAAAGGGSPPVPASASAPAPTSATTAAASVSGSSAPPSSSAPRPSSSQGAEGSMSQASRTSPLPPTLSAPEKSLFPNSLPVRQSLPSIHSFGAGASHPPISQGPYGDSRPRSSGADSKGAQPGRFGGSVSPYNTLPSLSNSGSPKLAAPGSTSQGAIRSSVSPRLPGLSQLSPPTPAAAPLPPSTSASTAGTTSSASYRNPMSVSSMLSAPSRDRPYGTVNSTASVSSPQPPVLPPASSPIVGSAQNGKSGSPPVPSIGGGFRRPSDGASALGSRESVMKALGQDKQPGEEKSGIASVAGASAGAEKDKDASRSSSAGKTERSYPPLPTAFARESPYSTWSTNSKKDLGFGARHDSNSSKESTPPAPHTSQNAQKQSGKSFFPNISSFSRPGATPSTAAPHRHSNSSSGQSSFPPTFPWTAATQQQQQQQQQAQQQQQPQSSVPSRAYPDFYHSSSSDSHRAQEEKRKAESPSSHHSPAQPSHSRQSSAQQHQPTKSHVRYPGSDAYSSTPARPSAGTSSSSTHANGAQEGWRQGETSASSSLHGASSSDRHKRRRSEGVSGGLRHEGGFADGKVKAIKVPFVPPFTLVDQRRATVRPPLLDVKSEAVLKALALPDSAAAAGKTDAASTPPRRAFLGRFVYDPFANPASLLDGRLLASNVGGVVEVAISTGWFEAAPYLPSSTSPSTGPTPLPSTLFEVGDPAKYDGSPMTDPSADESDPRIPPAVWELEGVRKRKVWGSDVYTDDSDVLALLLHSGWLRLGRRKPASKKLLAGDKGAGEEAIKASKTPWKGLKAAAAGSAAEQQSEKTEAGVKSLVVKLVVAPRLVRYQGCERMGLKSRNWGNGHDGVSLMVESVDVVAGLPRPHGRRWTKRKLGDVVALLLPKEVAAPPTIVDVLLPKDGAASSADVEKLSVGDTFILGPRQVDCLFVRPSPVDGLATPPEAEDGMEVDED